MSVTSLHRKFNHSLALRALTLSLALAFLTVAAPRLGRQDIPELPLPDGSGDTPEMVVKLVPSNIGPVVNQPKSLKLSSLRGKVVLLDMFLSTCSHCEEHAPHIVDFYNKYKERGFVVLGLARDPEEKLASVRQFMQKAKINYQVGFITNMVVSYYVDSHDHGVPQMVLFGADGKMAKRMIGWTPEVGKQMQQAIEEQLSKAGAAPSATVKPGSKANAKPAARKFKQV
jgi:glutathione peroxidase-family protein